MAAPSADFPSTVPTAFAAAPARSAILSQRGVLKRVPRIGHDGAAPRPAARRPRFPVLGCLVGRGKRGTWAGFAASLRAREGVRDGRSARTGRRSASRARLFDPEPRTPARQGRTLRGRYGAVVAQPRVRRCRRGLGGAETGACPNRSVFLPPPRRAPTAGGCDSPGGSEPSPASTTDASGASLVRPDALPIAQH